MKDSEGNVIKIGDIIAYNISYYNGVYRGMVTGFTAKQVKIKAISKDAYGTTKYSSTLLIIK